MDPAEKTRENRLRRAAKRQGLELQRHRSRDPRHALYGTYQLVRPSGSCAEAAKNHPAFGRSYGLSLDEAEKILAGEVMAGTSRADGHNAGQRRQEVGLGAEDGLVTLRIGGRLAARFDDAQQDEFLRHFHGAQLATAGGPDDE